MTYILHNKQLFNATISNYLLVMARGAIYFLVKNLVVNVFIGLHKYYHVNVDHHYVFIGLHKYYHINMDHCMYSPNYNKHGCQVCWLLPNYSH